MKRFNITVLTWCLLFAYSSAYAQQVPLFNQYFNQNALAYASSSVLTERPQLSLVQRGQWPGMFGTPQTLALSFSNPLNNKIGYSVNVNKFSLGLLNRNYIGAGLSKVKQFNNHKIAFGAELGMSLFSLNESRLSVENLNDELISNLLGNNGSAINLSFSLSYKYKSLSTHILIPNIVRESLSSESYLQLNRNTESDYEMAISYGLIMDPLKQFVFTPNLTIRYQDVVGMTFDINGELNIRDKFQLTGGYGKNFGSTVGIGVKLKSNILFSYNYAIGKNDVLFISSGFNEVGLQFKFSSRKEKEKELSERALEIIEKIRKEDIYDRNLISPEDKRTVLGYLASLEKGSNKEKEEKSEMAFDAILSNIKDTGLANMKVAADERRAAQIQAQLKSDEEKLAKETSKLEEVVKLNEVAEVVELKTLVEEKIKESDKEKTLIQSNLLLGSINKASEGTPNDLVGEFIIVVNAYKPESVWAKRYLATLIKEYPNAGIFKNKKRSYDYVYILAFNNFNEAVKMMKEFRKQKSFADSWVHVVRLNEN
uniref:PorP/SprF family type IX secretion system membrane protein n=1 Tax=Roseivirga sp. TaxID=1964215 RepID=UPI004048BED7